MISSNLCFAVVIRPYQKFCIFNKFPSDTDITSQKTSLEKLCYLILKKHTPILQEGTDALRDLVLLNCYSV